MLGLRIRRLRESQGKTLSEFSRVTSISKGYLSSLENDTRETNPTIGILDKIARGLGVDLVDLFDEDSSFDISKAIPQQLLSIVREKKKIGEPLDRDLVSWLAFAEDIKGSAVSQLEYLMLLRVLRQC